MSEDSSSDLARVLTSSVDDVKDFWERISDYLDVAEASEILRRYFVMNGFDGAMVMLGVVIGGFVGGISSPRVVLTAGVSTSVAIALSGFTSALLTERAEREKKVRDLEKAMFSDLEGSIIDDAAKLTTVFAALTNSLSPALFAVLSASPFIPALFGLISVYVAYITSIVLCLSLIFMLGVYLGRVSGGNHLVYGVYMLLAGVIVFFVGSALGLLGGV